MAAERGKPTAIGAGEVIADDDGQVEGFGDSLDAAHQIDGGADHREIEAVSSTDVAIEHLPHVKRHDDLERWLVKENRIVGEPVQAAKVSCAA